MRILITGTTGKVGGFLAQAWQHQHEVIAPTRKELDLQDEKALCECLDAKEFDLLVNSAALSTPEACDGDIAQAFAVNTTAPMVMAGVCADRNLAMIHLSTDYVLDGQHPGLKDEEATTAANQGYGTSKLAGERAVLASHPSAVIARVAWVFGTAQEAFLEKIYRLAKAGEPLEAVADKYSMPTCAHDLAEALQVLFASHARGIYHVTQSSEEPVSWHSYAEEVVLAMSESGLIHPLPKVKPRRMGDIAALASGRPQHTSMVARRLRLEFGHEMRNWKLTVRERVAQLSTKQSP